jgi:polysaccharide pyruvyl transferase WcaK-like protein
MTTLCKKLYPDLIDRARREKKGEFIAINCAFDRIEKRLNGRHDEILFNLAVTLRELSLTYPIAYYAHGKSDEQMLPYLDEVGVPYELVKLYDVHPREVIEAYSRAALAIGMRGHAQMIPFGCGTPIVSLISHDKIRWFLDDIRHPEWGIEMSSESFQKDLARRVFQTMETLDQTVATINIIQDELFETTQQNIHDLMSVLRDNTQKV